MLLSTPSPYKRRSISKSMSMSPGYSESLSSEVGARREVNFKVSLQGLIDLKVTLHCHLAENGADHALLITEEEEDTSVGQLSPHIRSSYSRREDHIILLEDECYHRRKYRSSCRSLCIYIRRRGSRQRRYYSRWNSQRIHHILSHPFHLKSGRSHPGPPLPNTLHLSTSFPPSHATEFIIILPPSPSSIPIRSPLGPYPNPTTPATRHISYNTPPPASGKEPCCSISPWTQRLAVHIADIQTQHFYFQWNPSSFGERTQPLHWDSRPLLVNKSAAFFYIHGCDSHGG